MPRLKPRKTIDARQTRIRIAKKMYHRLRLPTTSNAPVPTYIRWKTLSRFTGAPLGDSLVGTSRLLHGGAGGRPRPGGPPPLPRPLARGARVGQQPRRRGEGRQGGWAEGPTGRGAPAGGTASIAAAPGPPRRTPAGPPSRRGSGRFSTAPTSRPCRPSGCT